MKRYSALTAAALLVLFSLSIPFVGAYGQTVPYPLAAAFNPVFGYVDAGLVNVNGQLDVAGPSYLNGGAIVDGGIAIGGSTAANVIQEYNDGNGNHVSLAKAGGYNTWEQGANVVQIICSGNSYCESDNPLRITATGTLIAGLVLGTCSMVSATSCTVTDGTVSATSTILCAPEGSTLPTATAYTGSVITANTSYTVTAAASNSDTWRCMRMN